MKIVPLNDMVVLKKIEEKTTKGGLIIPASDRPDTEKCVRGEVLAVGPGRINERALAGSPGLTGARTRLPVNVEPGDVVLFERGIGGGYEITVDGEPYYLTREACIVAKLQEKVIT